MKACTRAWTAAVVLPEVSGMLLRLPAGERRANRLISLLEAGKPAIGVWTGALAAPPIARVPAVSDEDFIVADGAHDIFDFQALRRRLSDTVKGMRPAVR